VLRCRGSLSRIGDSCVLADAVPSVVVGRLA
jgi:hypothetical protein